MQVSLPLPPIHAPVREPQLAEQTPDVDSIVQAVQVIADAHASLSEPAMEPTAALTLDGIQDIMRQTMQQMTAAPPEAAPPEQDIHDLRELATAQAAELASARQAVQLMVQLLEQRLDASNREGEPSMPAVAEAAHMQADSLHQLLQTLVQQLGVPAAAADVEDHSQLVASQAAQLASARQAMQTMVQLLEQGEPAAEEDEEAMHLAEQSQQELHQALHSLLSDHRSQAPLQDTAVQAHAQVPIWIYCKLLRSLTQEFGADHPTYAMTSYMRTEIRAFTQLAYAHQNQARVPYSALKQGSCCCIACGAGPSSHMAIINFSIASVPSGASERYCSPSKPGRSSSTSCQRHSACQPPSSCARCRWCACPPDTGATAAVSTSSSTQPRAAGSRP